MIPGHAVNQAVGQALCLPFFYLSSLPQWTASPFLIAALRQRLSGLHAAWRVSLDFERLMPD